MEMDGVAFELKLGSEICCMASKERKRAQIKEHPSYLYHRSMCHVFYKIGTLSGQWFGLRSGGGQRSQRNI